MTPKIKTFIFFGVITLIAVIAGIVILQKTSEPQPGEFDSPALKASKQRIDTTKQPSKTQTQKK